MRARGGGLAPTGGTDLVCSSSPRRISRHRYPWWTKSTISSWARSVHIGGLPVRLTGWPTLREKAVALARIDLRLCATDDDADTVPLTYPIHVIGGSEDILVSESELRQWRSRTLAEFSMQMLKGGHFHVSDRKQLFAALRPLLSEVGSARAKVA